MGLGKFMEAYQVIILVLLPLILVITLFFVFVYKTVKKEREKNETFNYHLSLSEYVHGKIISIWVKYEEEEKIPYETSGFGLIQNGIGFYSGPGIAYKKTMVEDTCKFELDNIFEIIDENSFDEEEELIEVDSLTIERLDSQKYNIKLIGHYKEKEYTENHSLDNVLKLHIKFKDGYVEKIDNEEDL